MKHPNMANDFASLSAAASEEISIEAAERGFEHGSRDWEAFVERREEEIVTAQPRLIDLIDAYVNARIDLAQNPTHESAKAYAQLAETNLHDALDLNELHTYVGKEMIKLTTTVRTSDEWPAIPIIWLKCMEERDAALEDLRIAQQQRDELEVELSNLRSRCGEAGDD